VAARSRRAIAFVQRRPYFGLYRVQLASGDGPGRVHVVEPLFASSSRDLLPSIAPDGRQLAFVSDRSGSNGLWVGDVTQPDTLRMMGGVRPGTRYAPTWSPDSRRLLATGTDAHGRGVVQEVLAASGQVATLPVPDADPLQAQYSTHANRLFVLAASEDGAPQLRLYDRSSRPWRSLGRIDGVSHFEVDGPRNRILFTRLTEAGLWEVSLDLTAATIRRVSASEPTADRYRMWRVAPDGEIRYLERLQDCAASLRRIVPADGGQPRCLDQLRRSAVNGFSLGGPRGEVAYLALVDWDGADIGYMELPKETAEVVPGWIK